MGIRIASPKKVTQFGLLWSIQRCNRGYGHGSECNEMIILWMEESLHHQKDGWNPTNNGINQSVAGFHPRTLYIYIYIHIYIYTIVLRMVWGWGVCESVLNGCRSAGEEWLYARGTGLGCCMIHMTKRWYLPLGIIDLPQPWFIIFQWKVYEPLAFPLQEITWYLFSDIMDTLTCVSSYQERQHNTTEVSINHDENTGKAQQLGVICWNDEFSVSHGFPWFP